MGIASEMRGLRGTVKNILTSDYKTRGDDPLLYFKVCNQINPMVSGLTFGMVLQHRKMLGIPGFESVRRTRQYIQQHCPELKPNEEVNEARYEEWKEVRKTIKDFEEEVQQ